MNIIDFLEKYYPNYYSCNEVARMDDLSKYLSLEMEYDEMIEKGFVADSYVMSPQDAFNEFIEIQENLFKVAWKKI